MVSAQSSSGYVTASESGSVNYPDRSGAAVVDDEHLSEQDRVIRRYNCPCPITDCNVAGGIPFLVSHLSGYHEIPIHSRCSVEHCLKIRNRQEGTDAAWILTMMNCFGHYFCLHFEDFVLCGVPIYMVYVRLMGSKEDAGKYKYTVELHGDGRAMLVWDGFPRSIRDSHGAIRRSVDGLALRKNHQLVTDTGSSKLVRVTVHIRRNVM